MITERAEPELSMIRFLLGEMADEERASFENAYIKDTALFHCLVELENDLLDLYAMDALSPAERKRVEHSFLADPERRKRLAFSRALVGSPAPAIPPVVPRHGQTVVVPQTGTGSSTWKMWLAAAALFLASVTAITWLVIANHRLRAEVAALRKQQEITTPTAGGQKQSSPVSDVNIFRPPTPKGSLDQIAKTAPGVLPDRTAVFFTLMADGLRGNSDVPNLTIPSTASFAFIHLVFPKDSFSRYHLLLETANGSQVWEKRKAKTTSLTAHNKEIVIKVPSGILKAGDYVLRIIADNGPKNEDVAGYSFRVLRP